VVPRTRFELGTSELASRALISFSYSTVKVKSLSLTKRYAMEAYRGVEVKIHVFLTSVLVGSEWSASRPGCSTSDTHWIGGGVGPRAGLNDMEK
jgi:hypothetical protein